VRRVHRVLVAFSGRHVGTGAGNDAYTHILLIFPLSAALIYLDSKHMDSKAPDSKALRIRPQPSPSIGAALLALALVIGGYARWGWAPRPAMSGYRSACSPW